MSSSAGATASSRARTASTTRPRRPHSSARRRGSSPSIAALHGGERFDLGDREIEVLHVPGHSPGHLALWDAANSRTRDLGCRARRHGSDGDRRPRLPADLSRHRRLRRRRIHALREYDADLLLTAHYPLYEGDGRARLPRRVARLHRPRRRADRGGAARGIPPARLARAHPRHRRRPRAVGARRGRLPDLPGDGQPRAAGRARAASPWASREGAACGSGWLA